MRPSSTPGNSGTVADDTVSALRYSNLDWDRIAVGDLRLNHERLQVVLETGLTSFAHTDAGDRAAQKRRLG